MTSLTQGTGITITGSGNSRTIALTSGVGANTSKGDTTNQTPAFGDTFKALSATVDTYGRTTALGEHTIKIPDTIASNNTDGLMSSSLYNRLFDNTIGTNSTILSAGQTSTTLNLRFFGIIPIVSAFDLVTGESVVVDSTFVYTMMSPTVAYFDSVTISIASAWTNDIGITVYGHID